MDVWVIFLIIKKSSQMLIIRDDDPSFSYNKINHTHAQREDKFKIEFRESFEIVRLILVDFELFHRSKKVSSKFRV